MSTMTTAQPFGPPSARPGTRALREQRERLQAPPLAGALPA